MTPKSYLSFMNSYKQVYTNQHHEIEGLFNRMNTGLVKLMEASQTVQELNVELVQKEKDLVVRKNDLMGFSLLNVLEAYLIGKGGGDHGKNEEGIGYFH